MYEIIIPKKSGFVKCDLPFHLEIPEEKIPKEGKNKGKMPKPANNRIKAWEIHKAASTRIADKFYAIFHLYKTLCQAEQATGNDEKAYEYQNIAVKFYERGQRMYNCANFILHGKCPDCGRTHTSSAMLCRDRVCPTCNWRLSLQQAVEMQNTLALINDLSAYKAAFFCVTLKNCAPEDLKGTLERMAAAWNRMLNRKKPKRDFLGWARRVEITYNHNTRTFHPHYHVILLVRADHPDSLYDMNLLIRDYWKSALRLDYDPVTDFEWIEDLTAGGLDENATPQLHKAILETFKYTVKDDELASMPLELFRQFVEQIQSKRLTAYGGVIKEARAQLEYTDDLDNEQQSACGECSNPILNRVIYKWSFASNTYERFENIMTANMPKIPKAGG